MATAGRVDDPTPQSLIAFCLTVGYSNGPRRVAGLVLSTNKLPAFSGNYSCWSLVALGIGAAGWLSLLDFDNVKLRQRAAYFIWK